MTVRQSTIEKYLSNLSASTQNEICSGSDDLLQKINSKMLNNPLDRSLLRLTNDTRLSINDLKTLEKIKARRNSVTMKNSRGSRSYGN